MFDTHIRNPFRLLLSYCWRSPTKYCTRLTTNIAALLLALCVVMPAAAQRDAVIKDIRIEGLQRVAAESVFAVLPLDVGDRLTESAVANTVRAVFGTGNFQNVELGIDQGVLVVLVEERPSISAISIEGNKAIQTESLLDGLRNQGCLLYTSPSPRDRSLSRMPSSA